MTTPPYSIRPLFKVLAPLATILLVVIVALSLLRSQLKTDVSGGGSIKVGATAPDIPLERLSDGKQVRLSELLTAPRKIVMLNFWATWCAACISEMPSIVRLHKAYRERGFDVIAVNLDEDPQESVPSLVQKLGMEFSVYLDTQEQGASTAFNVSGIPLTIILNEERKILMIEPGERDWDGVEEMKQLEEWLGG